MNDFFKMLDEKEQAVWRKHDLEFKDKQIATLCDINRMLRDKIIELEETIRSNSFISRQEYRTILEDVVRETLKQEKGISQPVLQKSKY